MPPFEMPESVRTAWAGIARRGAEARAAWKRRLAASPHQASFEIAQRRGPVAELDAALAEHKRRLVADAPKVATRKASEMALEVVNAALPDTVGGSADLTGSNNTRTKGMAPVTADDYAGRYVHWGIREHGMAAAMNGIALHGGLRPYGGTFLAFADYCRPAIRLSALMGLPVTYVMTHDLIGLGEDGPTHQPVEQIASLRAIPNLTVIRPADAVETAEAWEMAMSATRTPTLLCLSRQNLPTRAPRAHRRQPHRPRRLRAPRARGPARGDDRRHRLRGRDRARGRRPPRRAADRGGGGLGALVRALRGAGRGLPRRGARRGADGRGRGGDPPGLAGDDRLRRAPSSA